jgi:prepilin-type N-terminal cleavage/methylation domain-containing protein
MIKKILKNKKGFTLLELAISSSILAVIFGGITIFGAQTIRNFDRSQAIKNAVENSSYAIERLNKSIRTSNNVEGYTSEDEIFIKDNKTGANYCYFFQGDKLRVKTSATDSHDECSDISNSTASDLVGGGKTEISGSFKVKETDRDNSKRGFVRTNIVIKYNGDRVVDEDEIVIQSSVSLRDYGFYDPTP